MAYNPMDYVHNVPTRVAVQIQAGRSNPWLTGTQGTKPAAKRGPVSQTLQQVANQRVNQQLNPQIAAQNAFNTRQSNVIQQFANALLGKLQPVAGQVGADYDQAIKQIGSLSGQAAQYFSGQNPDASQQKLLSSVGAPPEQQAQATQGLGDTFKGGAGVLAYTGGTIPGSQLATDKAAAQAQAAQLPGIAALKGQQDLSSALWQQGQTRRELEATRPALYQQAVQDIRTNQAARAKLAQAQQQLTEKQREFGITTDQKQAAADFLNWYRTQGLNLTQQQIDQKAAQFGVTSAIAQQNANTAVARAATAATAAQVGQGQRSYSNRLKFANTFGYDPQTGRVVKGYTINKSGQVVKIPTAGKGRAPSRLTAGQVQKYRGTAATVANKGSAGFTDITKDPDFKSTKENDPNGWSTQNASGTWTNHHPKSSPATVLKAMREAGIPDPLAIQALNRAYGTHFNPKGTLP